MQSNSTQTARGRAWRMGWLLGSLDTRVQRLRRRPRGTGIVATAACLLLLVGLLPEVAPESLLPRRNVHLLGGPLLAALLGLGLVLGMRWIRYLSVIVLAAAVGGFTRLYANQALPVTAGWLVITLALAAALALLLTPAAGDFFRARRTPSADRAPFGRPPG